jgi:DNA-binding NarL/FixJ family response regulator
MDINMSKMDGVTATRLMTGQHPNVAVVGLSVTEDQYHKAAMKMAGAFEVMTKGKHDVDDLCQEIEKAAARIQFLSHAAKKAALLKSREQGTMSYDICHQGAILPALARLHGIGVYGP